MLKLLVGVPFTAVSVYYVWTVVHGLMYYTSHLLLATVN